MRWAPIHSWVATVGKVAQAALDALLPHLCLFCDQPTHNGAAICDCCVQALEPNNAGCPRCALPRTGGSLCAECQSIAQPEQAPLGQITAPWVYDDYLSHLMQRWKYGKERRLQSAAAYLLLSSCPCLDRYDLVLATPLHWQRHFSRGFNQSEDLLNAIARRKPRLQSLRATSPRLLRRQRTGKQALGSRQERLRNMRAAFEVRGDAGGRRVLIIDDICTTGATATAMAQALKGAGASRVSLWCMARTPRHQGLQCPR